jgi:hypothetical protein
VEWRAYPCSQVRSWETRSTSCPLKRVTSSALDHGALHITILASLVPMYKASPLGLTANVLQRLFWPQFLGNSSFAPEESLRQMIIEPSAVSYTTHQLLLLAATAHPPGTRAMVLIAGGLSIGKGCSTGNHRQSWLMYVMYCMQYPSLYQALYLCKR